MDSFELNRMAMAFLIAVVSIMGSGFISQSIFHPRIPKQPGFMIEVVSAPPGVVEEKNAQSLAYEPVARLLASADVRAGARVAKKCVSCHTFDKGGKKKIGPNLYDVVNKPIATNGGFGYSKGLKAFSDGKKWDYANLNGFLFKPRKYVKGTSMGFAGLKKTVDRANIIAYLRSLSDDPALLPAE